MFLALGGLGWYVNEDDSTGRYDAQQYRGVVLNDMSVISIGGKVTDPRILGMVLTSTSW